MTDVVADLERQLATLSRELTAPDGEECVLCYVRRMLTDHGCDCTLRWARRYRDLRAPRATRLETRLGRRGGYCDCEILLDGLGPARHLLVVDEHGVLQHPSVLPACTGARPGSTRPCATWVPYRFGHPSG